MKKTKAFDFLPDVFKTEPNRQFLTSTIDQLFSTPKLVNQYGYIGEQFSRGTAASDSFVSEITDTRKNYQLTPAVCIQNPDSKVTKDFIQYTGILNSLGFSDDSAIDQSALFSQPYYAWEPFIDLDKLVNFSQYCWLPNGPEAVEITSEELSSDSEIILKPTASGYVVTLDGEVQPDVNQSLQLLRGGQYTIKVQDSGGTWIQGSNTFDGFDSTRPNVNTREIFGVTNNGIQSGIITFNVPLADAQNGYDKSGTLKCDLVWDQTLQQLDNKTVLSVTTIDGIPSIDCENKTVLIFNASQPIQSRFYKIVFSGDQSNPVINLIQTGSVIPSNTRITILSGVEYQGKHFFRDSIGKVTLVPYLSAGLTTLYIRDAQNENCVCVIGIIADRTYDVLDIEKKIIGQKQYTSKNGVKFVNGLKVYFTGDVTPVEYKDQNWYVEGVGKSITLVGESTLEVYEPFAKTKLTGYDVDYFDNSPFDGALTLPVDKDYITINRASSDSNAWSRSNRWVHISTLEETVKANNSIVSTNDLYDLTNRAKRPIIEFNANIKLFDHASNGRGSIDYFIQSNTKVVVNVKTLDVISTRESDSSILLNSVSGVLVNDLVQFGGDTSGTTLLADTVYVVLSVNPSTNRITVREVSSSTVWGMIDATTSTTSLSAQIGTQILGANLAIQTDLNGSQACFIDVTEATPFNPDCAVFDGCKIISSIDTNALDRLSIFKINFSQTTQSGNRVITVSQPFASVVSGDGFVVKSGNLAAKSSFYYSSATGWQTSQLKTTVNQPPLFDIVDTNKISFSNTSYYPASNFAGCTLFEFATDVSNTNDIELGFPLQYKELNGIGEICFNSTFNTDVFTFTSSNTKQQQGVRQGFVIKNKMRNNGWRYGFADTIQYQVFEKQIETYNVKKLNLDVLISTSSVWPAIKLFVNGEFFPPDTYTLSTAKNKTIITMNSALKKGDMVTVKFLSNAKSQASYYEVPHNLQTNAFNGVPSTLTLSDLKNHYQSCFENAGLLGTVFGKNQFSNSGDLVKYGSKIIQHSASLINAGAFLRGTSIDLFDSIEYSSVEYEKIKAIIADQTSKLDFSNLTHTDEKLDLIFSQIASIKSEESPFFWSSMLATETPITSNHYSIGAETSNVEYRLENVTSYQTGENYFGVLVYLYRENANTGIIEKTLLLKGIDYHTSNTEPLVIVTKQLLEEDVIEVNEYNKVYANFVPMTPSKIGFVEHFKPQVFEDSTYIVPTWVMVGHDGSKSRLYGDIQDGEFTDIRDECLFEFEKRIFNNIQETKAPVLSKLGELMPGFFRVNDSIRQTFFDEYKKHFVNWAGKYRIDFQSQFFSKTNSFTWNYRGAIDKFGNTINQGNWKGIYLWYYDCINPAETPWRMLGYLDKPVWFDARYGVAPYTRTNSLLWGDLENGYDYNNGSPIVRSIYARPGLSKIIPVSNSGSLLSPIESIIVRYDPSTINQPWVIGDFGPAEYAYLNSSSFKFDLVKIMVKLRPAKFFAYGFDLDAYKYDSVNGQWIFTETQLREIENQHVKYGASSPEAQRGYVCWVCDYGKHFGIDAVSKISDVLDNLDVRLSHRLAGFSDKTMMKFWVEKSSLNDNGSSLLIPDENYSLILYNNPVQTKITYSAVVVQKTTTGYRVWGNSQYEAKFEIATGLKNGFYQTLNFNGKEVKLSKNVDVSKIINVPYGTEFLTVDDVCDFLLNYGRLLESKGMEFTYSEHGKQIDWMSSITEFVLWTQTNWGAGAIIQLNPCANQLTINHPSLVVQPMQIIGKNYALNQHAIPIATTDLCVHRDGHKFQIEPLTTTDTISFAQFDLSSVEHAVVFDNETSFGDIINSNTIGLRQSKLISSIKKTAEWSGLLDTSGFILNQDNINEWSSNMQYGIGSIVKYQNAYWTANEIVYPTTEFNFRQWTRTEYDQIQKGLLSNSTTRSIESSRYYDIDQANLEKSSDLLAFNLIGYSPREYMASADLDDITQVNVYKNMLGVKGTASAQNLFKNTKLLRGEIDYSVTENWAIKHSEYGSKSNDSEIEVSIDKQEFTHNPVIVNLFNKFPDDNADLNINVRDLGISNANVFEQIQTPKVFKNSGIIDDFDSINHKVYSLADSFDWSTVKQYEYIWIAQRHDATQEWDIVTPITLPNIDPDIDGELTVTQISATRGAIEVNVFVSGQFRSTIKRGDVIVLADVTSSTSIPDITSNVFQILKISGQQLKLKAFLPINSTISKQNLNLVIMKLCSVKITDTVQSLTVNPNFLQKAKLWIDRYNEPSKVLTKQNIFYEVPDYLPVVQSSENFGTALSHNKTAIFVSDVSMGKVHRYTASGQYVSTLTGLANGFGDKLLLTESGTLFVTDTLLNKVFVYHIHPSAQIVVPELTQTISLSAKPSSIALSADEKWLVVGSENSKQVFVFSKYQDYTRYKINGTTFTKAPKAGDKVIYLSGDITSTVNPGVLLSFASTEGSKVYAIVSSSYSNSVTTVRLLDQLEREFVNLGEVYVAETDYTLQNTIYKNLQGFGEVVDISDDGETIAVGASKWDQDVFHTNVGKCLIYTNINRVLNVKADGKFQANIGWTPSAIPLVYKNGIELKRLQFSIVSGSQLVIENCSAGDQISVMGGKISLMQTIMSSDENSVGQRFGSGLGFASNATDLFIGAPGKPIDATSSGQVIRYIDLANSTFSASVAPVTNNAAFALCVNNVVASIPASVSLETLALLINQAYIQNITASVIDDAVVISSSGSTLIIRTFGDNIEDKYIEYDVFAQKQVLSNPVAFDMDTGFGSSIKRLNDNSVVISAPNSTSIQPVEFDWIDDLKFNDCVFDQNTTTFVDQSKNTGQLFIFDKIDSDFYQLSQALYDNLLSANSKFSKTFSVNADQIIVSASVNTGQVCQFKTTGNNGWDVTQTEVTPIDYSKIHSVEVINPETNEIISQLEIFDPVSGYLLPQVKTNIDYMTDFDPAGYSNSSIIWGENQMGQIWLDTSTLRFTNYYSPDVKFASEHWGMPNTTSQIKVSTWVESLVPPEQYKGQGVANKTYIIGSRVGNSTQKYYFWVTGANTISPDHSLSDVIIAEYIRNPYLSGIPYVAFFNSHSFAVFNASDVVSTTEVTVRVNFGHNDAQQFNEYRLIKTGDNVTEFFDGIPSKISASPYGLYLKMLDSLCGMDLQGNLVPDPSLTSKQKYGVKFRPRQSMFVDRTNMVYNLVQFVNDVFLQYPMVELRNPTLLFKQGDEYVNEETGDSVVSFNTPDFWEYTTWWDTGYSSNTKINVQVKRFENLAFVKNKFDGMIAKVLKNSQGQSEYWVYISESSNWQRVGLTNGTFKLKQSIATGFGFDIDTFGEKYDSFPGEETRNIVRSLIEEIFIDDLQVYRNKLLHLVFSYIQQESSELGNYLPWLMKTSFLDVVYQAGSLTALSKYQKDNQSFLEGYLNEVKPYHCVIKDFEFKYDGGIVYQSTTTDFDIPAKFNESSQKYISPQIVYSESDIQDSAFQKLYTNTVWSDWEYTNWRENYDLKLKSLGWQSITKLTNWVNTKDTFLYVDNANGLPVSGTLLIDSEQITYTSVDRVNGIVSGLSRGANDTPIQQHLVNAEVKFSMPAIMVMNSGRGYSTTPKVSFSYPLQQIQPSSSYRGKAIMVNGGVTGISVSGSGKGVVSLPVVTIEPAFSASFNSSNVNLSAKTIRVVSSSEFKNGDLIKFECKNGIGKISGLISGQHYWIGVVYSEQNEGIFTQDIAFYVWEQDANNDVHRIDLIEVSSNTQAEYIIHQGAFAICSGKADNVRKMSTVLKFDRTSYQSKVTAWESGSYYAGSLENTLKKLGTLSSSSETLFSCVVFQQPTLVPISATSGSGLQINVFNTQYGGINTDNYVVTFNTLGTGYKIGDQLVVYGSQLGGQTVLNDIQIRIDDITVIDENTSSGSILAYSVSGIPAKIGTQESITYANVVPTNVLSAGTGASVTVKRFDRDTPPANTYSIGETWTGGSGYEVGETFNILGSSLGGKTPDNDAIVTITSVVSGGAVSGMSISGSGKVALKISSFAKNSSVPGHIAISSIDTSGTTTKLSVEYNGALNPAEIDNEKIYFYTEPVAFYDCEHQTTAVGSGAKFNVFAPVFDTTLVKPQFAVELAFDSSGIEQCGLNYKAGQILTIPGSNVGGVSPDNDIQIKIEYTFSGGRIGAFTAVGKCPNVVVESYYGNVISDTEIELYKYPSKAGVVKSVGFSSSDVVYGVVSDFTNYSQSLVTYEGRLYQCLVSNNDTLFDYDKWKVITGSSDELNATDRIFAYYAPTSGMAGNDLKQLMKGVAYSKPTYLGNPFSSELGLDVQVTSFEFDQIETNLIDVVYDSGVYRVLANNSDQSQILTLSASCDWVTTINLSSDVSLSATSILKSNNEWIISTQTPDSELLVNTSIATSKWVRTSIPSIENINQVLEHNGNIFVIGSNVNMLNASNIWEIAFQLDENWFDVSLKCIKYVEIEQGFNGYLVTGSAYKLPVEGESDFPSKQTVMITGIIDPETNLIIWEQLDSGMLGQEDVCEITTFNNQLFACGSNGYIWNCTNPLLWDRIQIDPAITLTSIAASQTAICSVGLDGEFYASDDGIIWNKVTTSTTSDFTKIKYFSESGKWIAIGSDKTLFVSDDGIVFVNETKSINNRSAYSIVGDSFEAGYSPEEMVSGIVKESISISVETTPSGDFGGYQSTYEANGFKVFTFKPEIIGSMVYFANKVECPMMLQVYTENKITHESILVTETAYTVNWKNQIITFNSVEATFSDTHDCVISIFEVGGGNQIFKGNTLMLPVSAGNEIYIPVSATKVIDTVHPVFRNGKELIPLVDYTLQFTDDGNCKLVFVEAGDPAVDYAAFSIMGKSSSDLIEVVTTGIAPQSFELKMGMKAFLTSQTWGQVFLQNLDTEQWVETSEWSVTNGIVTITDSGMVENQNVRIKMKDFGSPEIVTSNSNIISLPNVIAQYASYDSLVVYVDNVKTTDFVLSSDRLTLTVNSPSGNTFKVLTRQYSLAEPYEFEAATQNQTVFAHDNTLSADHTSHAIVWKNGLRIKPADYTIQSGSIVFDSGCNEGDIVSMMSFDNIKNQNLKTYESNTVRVVAIDRVVTTASEVKIELLKATHNFQINDIVFIDGFETGATQLNAREFKISAKVTSTGDSDFDTLTLKTLTDVGYFDVDPIGIVDGATGGYIWHSSQFVYSEKILTTDRLMVFVNGYRIFEPYIKTYDSANRVGILFGISAGDWVIITKLCARQTPDAAKFKTTIDNSGNETTYRIPAKNQAWVTTDVLIDADSIQVSDVTRLVNTTTFEKLGSQIIELTGVDRTQLVGVQIFNKTTLKWVSQNAFSVKLIELVPTILFDAIQVEVSENDVLAVYAYEGNFVWVNGEMIRFSKLDFANNRISGLTRGVSCTPINNTIQTGSSIVGMLNDNKLDAAYNSLSWNTSTIDTPDNYGFVMSDPLQLSNTYPAKFLTGRI